MIRVAIIGVGNQGRHHLRSIGNVEGLKLVLAIDKNLEKARHSGEEFGVPFGDHYRGALDSFDAAIVAVPTSEHHHIAMELIDAGKHLLIEKPVTQTVEQAEDMSSAVRKAGTIAHVGFPERFNPAVLEAMPAITKPMFIESHRLGMFSPRSLDVDVILDLMIHDLDLLHLFLKEEPTQIEAVGVPVLSQNVDIANARLKFPGKCVVNMTASRVSAQRMRKMRLFQPYSYLSIDFAQQSFSQYSLEPNMCNAGFPEIRKNDFVPRKTEHPLEKELAAFRDAIANSEPGGVTIEDALPSLRMALAVKAAFS